MMVGTTTYTWRTPIWCATDIYVSGAPKDRAPRICLPSFPEVWAHLYPWCMEVWCATDICHMCGALPFHAPRMWGPDTPGDGAHICVGAPLVWCATHKARSVAHITWCATDIYPWSTKTECAIDNGPMDKYFPSSAWLNGMLFLHDVMN
jgi:hypothetical protein